MSGCLTSESPNNMALRLITDSSPAMWSDPTHEVNLEIDAKIVFRFQTM